MIAAPCGTAHRRGRFGACALLAGILAAPGPAPVSASGPELVNCHDAARGLVQRVLPQACGGRIVDDARAAELERQHRHARATRFRAGERSRDERQRGARSGSAVFVSGDGHLVTAKHVIDGCRAIEVMLPSGRPAVAELVRTAADADLAVLKVDHRPVAMVPLAPLQAVNPGADTRKGIRAATAIGFPSLGRVVVRPVATRAPVLGIKALRPGPLPRLVLQARVHPGHSGGPVVDREGRLIGILVAKLDRAAVFARVGELPPDMAFAEIGRTVADLLEAAGVRLAPAGGREPGVQAALRASVRIACKP